MFKSFSELNSLILPLLAYLFPDITVLKVRFVLQNLRNLSRVISVNRCLIFKVHPTWFLWFSSFFASSEAPFLKWALPLYQILLPLSTLFFHLFYLFFSLSSTLPGVAFGRYSFLIFLAPFFSCKCWGRVLIWVQYVEILVNFLLFYPCKLNRYVI